MNGVSETKWLDEQEQRAWRSFQMMTVELAARMHRSLVAATGLSLPDYEVMVYLSEAPDDRLRAFELGAALKWEKSRLSHHLTRMERRGLVCRQQCESDARGQFVQLTAEGRAAIEKAAPHHVDDVRRLMIDHLDTDDLTQIATISERLLEKMSAESNNEVLCD